MTLVGSLARLTVQPNFGCLISASEPKVPFYGALARIGIFRVGFTHMEAEAELALTGKSRNSLAAVPFGITAASGSGRHYGEKHGSGNKCFHGVSILGCRG